MQHAVVVNAGAPGLVPHRAITFRFVNFRELWVSVLANITPKFFALFRDSHTVERDFEPVAKLFQPNIPVVVGINAPHYLKRLLVR